MKKKAGKLGERTPKAERQGQGKTPTGHTVADAALSGGEENNGVLPPSDNRPISVIEWLAEGRRRFGDDYQLWKFRCPVCGHVQTPGDFGAIGQEPQSAYQECIGRHMPNRASNLAGTPGKNGKKSPCDFAAYGLFQFGWKVVNENGKAIPVLPFADSPPADSNAPSVDGVAAGVPPLTPNVEDDTDSPGSQGNDL